MKKVINLTESELKRLVSRIISEVKNNISPKNLKIGDGGRQNPKQLGDVKALQSKLMKLGILKTKSGVPTGYFGNLTNAALNSYNGVTKTKTKPQKTDTIRTDKKVKPVVKTQKNKDGLLTSLIKNVRSAVKVLGDIMGLPLHIRACMNFIRLRSLPFTINDLKDVEQKALREMMNFAAKKGLIKNGRLNFYDVSNQMGTEKIVFSNKTLGVNQTNIKSEYTKIAMTFGNAGVQKVGTGFKISDTYDFNNYMSNPEKYTLAQTPKTVGDAIVKIGQGNYVQGMEQMLSYFQKFGYEGFKIDILV